jgi:polyketide cyclase/dehydrase/lipid transport protein
MFMNVRGAARVALGNSPPEVPLLRERLGSDRTRSSPEFKTGAGRSGRHVHPSSVEGRAFQTGGYAGSAARSNSRLAAGVFPVGCRHFSVRSRASRCKSSVSSSVETRGVSSHSIEVNAPLRAVYNQWTQFEEFPRFMEGVEEVRQEGEKRLFWKAKIAGRVKEWEAEITNQVPDQRIASESIDGSPNSGTIAFEEISADWTRVNATIGYELKGLLEKTGTP